MDAVKEILETTNWEFSAPKDQLFSSDNVIEAYLKGKKDGLEQAQKLMFDKLISNISISGQYTSQVISFLKKNNISPLSAHLKINSWDDFKAIITQSL